MYYIDTNIFVYALAADRQFGPASKAFLERVTAGTLAAATSSYTLAELYATLRSFGFSEALIWKGLEKTLEFGVRVLSLTPEIVSGVPAGMARGWKFGDVIHLLTMQANKIDVIVSEDAHFDRMGARRVGVKGVVREAGGKGGDA